MRKVYGNDFKLAAESFGLRVDTFACYLPGERSRVQILMAKDAERYTHAMLDADGGIKLADDGEGEDARREQLEIYLLPAPTSSIDEVVQQVLE